MCWIILLSGDILRMKYLLLILTISLISAHSHASQKADRDTELYKRDKQHKTISTYFTSAVVKQIKKFKQAAAFKHTIDKFTTSEIEVENAKIKIEYDVFVPVIHTSATQHNGRILYYTHDFKNNKHIFGLTIPWN